MRRYSVEVARDAATKFFYIMNCDTLEVELLPSKYLKHLVKANRSSNTVKRASFAICYYMEYLAEKKMQITEVYALAYEEQSEHFVHFLYWLKAGNHREKNKGDHINNGTCNAYLKDVFRFYLFMEIEEQQFGSLKLLFCNQISVANSAGVKRVLRFKSFKGYLKAEEQNVRAAKQDEIVEILDACTNCRDQLLILLLVEAGFRIGELLGVDYSRDIDYGSRTIRVYFRDDNENEAKAKNAEYRRAKISREAYDFLLYYLAEYRELQQHQKYLFINISGDITGNPLKVGSIYDMLGRVEKKTGIKITPHMLRRYFANARREAGCPLELIQQALGQKHLDTAIRYLNVVDEKLIEARNRFYEEHTADYGIRKLP